MSLLPVKKEDQNDQGIMDASESREELALYIGVSPQRWPAW